VRTTSVNLRINKELHLDELRLRFSYRLRLVALILAGFLMVSGAVMVFLGISGSIDFGLHATGVVQAHLVNASPGIAFELIALFLCYLILSQGPPPAGSAVPVGSTSIYSFPLRKLFT
jgi:hypothetical protein